MEPFGLTYFDSLLAASAIAVDAYIVSDEIALDRVRGLERIPISPSPVRKASAH